MALRANDTPTAKHVSENLGQVEQVEANEGMSYGVNDMRDGVNLSRMQVTRPLVMHTEVTNLPNLSGYLRFGRNLPVVRFEDSYNKVPSVAVAFEERTASPIRLVTEGTGTSPLQPSAAASKSKRRRASDNAPTLPLPDPQPSERAPTSAPQEPVAPPPRPQPEITLFGKPAGFRLRQHGRRDGDRDEARPA